MVYPSTPSCAVRSRTPLPHSRQRAPGPLDYPLPPPTVLSHRPTTPAFTLSRSKRGVLLDEGSRVFSCAKVECGQAEGPTSPVCAVEDAGATPELLGPEVRARPKTAPAAGGASVVCRPNDAFSHKRSPAYSLKSRTSPTFRAHPLYASECTLTASPYFTSTPGTGTTGSRQLRRCATSASTRVLAPCSPSIGRSAPLPGHAPAQQHPQVPYVPVPGPS